MSPSDPGLRAITLLQPPRLAFGVGCRLACAADLAEAGARAIVLVTTDRGLAQAADLLAALRAKHLHVTPLTGIPPEPALADFARLHAQLAGIPCDTVIGFGGGSVLDVAKLLAARHGAPGTDDVAEFFGIGLLPPRRTRLVCLPTTAGTGSEVSPNSILLDPAARLKKGVISPHLVPDAAYVDPELTVSVPPALTAATGLDALTHCVEAFANLHAHPLVDLYALEGVRLISAHLARAVAAPADLTARTAVARGSLYGGLCLGPVNTAAVHALAYPLGGTFGVPHGLANALLLTATLRFNLPAAPARYAALAVALGVPARVAVDAGFTGARDDDAADSDADPASDPADDLAIAEAGLARLEALCRACGLPRGLASQGVTADAIPALAASALTVTRLLKNNPRPLTAADAAAIYHAAL